MTRRAFARRSILPLAGLLLLGLPLRGAAAEEEDGHGDGHADPTFGTQTLAAGELVRFNRLMAIIVCKCPRENWSKSLAGCPDSCSYPQKLEIRDALKAGRSDDAIIQEQVRLYGPKVLGQPPAKGLTGFLVYAGPFIIFAALGAAVIAVLAALVRRKKPVSQAKAAAPEVSPEDRRWSDEIDRELEAMD